LPQIRLLPLSARLNGLLVCVLLCVAVWVNSDPYLLSDRQLNAIEKQYGNEALSRIRQWQDLLVISKNLDKDEKLAVVNNFINQMEFVSDESHWGTRDYWATPIEFLATNGGDCEDFSIAKYYSLQGLGIEKEKLRLIYAKATSIDQAHMVLAYYATPKSEPLILDNLDKLIKPASQRQDLIPSYSFNGDTLWEARKLREGGIKVGRSENIGVWKKLLDKIRLGR
ncbi:MAG: transglutaminase-like cysteine peptidase, partial [Gammaproteobacteria bacterium]|nr:transglutaminase-like cysteine peptidase [Gammaproteobacteria bacterium]